MPHLLGGAVENHEARVRRQHAMHFLERRERVRHMMMHEGAGRAVEASRRERDRLGARVVPRDRRRFLLRPREHRRRQFEPANRHARLIHRDRVIPGPRSDIEIAARSRADADDESGATANTDRPAASCRNPLQSGRRAPRYICSPPTVSTIALSSSASTECSIARSSATSIPAVTTWVLPLATKLILPSITCTVIGARV